MSETFDEFCRREDLRDMAIAVVSSHERGHHAGPGLHVDLASGVLELLDRLGHPRCDWKSVNAFVASEQEYNVFLDSEKEGSTS
jgi:hypothetical protein